MEASQQNISEITISYIAPLENAEPLAGSEDAFNYIINGFNQHTIGCQEQLVVLYLNQGNKPLGLHRASQGGITGTVTDIRLILSIALKSTAVALIIAHNHPSGQLKPSMADKEMTRKLKAAAELMDIKMLDHLIVGPQKAYYSFADDGIL